MGKRTAYSILALVGLMLISGAASAIPKEKMKAASKMLGEKANQAIEDGFPSDHKERFEEMGETKLRDPDERDAAFVSLCPAILRSYIGDAINTSMAWVDTEIRVERMEEIPEMSKVAGFMWALQSGIPLRQRSQYHVPRIEMSTYPYDIEEVYACFDDGVSYYENAKLKDPWMFEKVFGEELSISYN